MKYLLVGLILLAGVTGPPTALPSPTHDLHATAIFTTSDPPGTTTEVDIYVDDASALAQIRLSVYRVRQACDDGVCREVRLIAANTAQMMAPGDVSIDRQLRDGFVHSVLRLHDDISKRELTVHVDVMWSANGPPVCTSLPDGDLCSRVASVLGNVASGSDRFIANQTAPDGQLIQRSSAR